MTQVSTNKRSVLDERFLKCGVCNERFWDNSKLIKHMESHDEERPLLCTICNKTFERIQDLDKHYLLHRQLMQPYGCPACESRFVTQQQLIVHVDNIHPELTIGNKSDTNDNVTSIPSTSTQAVNIKSSPQLNKNQIKIVSVQSIPKTAAHGEKEGPSKEKPPVIELQLPLPSTKKSILKTAPTPVGKKRPLVWKDPIVSPEKKVRGDLTLKVVGEKRGLVILPQDAINQKRLKIVTSEATVVSRNPTVQTPIRCSIVSSDANKNMTPPRKAPITKTKLMQSVADLCDKQIPNEKKSLVETRKNLLNGLQITSVPGGPIRVSKVAKQPFIVYSPCKENNRNQSGDSSSESKKSIQAYTSNWGNSSDKKVDQTVSAKKATPNFDAVKLLPSTNLSSSITINIADKSKVQQQVSAFDILTKNTVSSSKSPPTIQVVPIQTTPIHTVQSSDLKNAGRRKVVKIDKLPKVIGVAKKPMVKSASVISAVNQFSPKLVNVPQSSLIKSSVESPIIHKITPGDNLSKTNRERLTRSQKLATSAKRSTTKANKSEDVTQPQLISETEVLRDPELQCQQLKILLPSIRLKRLSDVEIKLNNENCLEKLQVVDKSCIKEQEPTKTSDVEEQADLKCAEPSVVKRSRRLQQAAKRSNEEKVKLTCARGRRVKARDKLQSSESSNFEEQSELKCTEANEVKTNDQLQFPETNSVQGRSHLKHAKSSSVKSRRKFQSATSSIQERVETSGIQKKGNLQSSEMNNTEGEPKLKTVEAGKVKTYTRLQSSKTSSVEKEKENNSKSGIKTQTDFPSFKSNNDQEVQNISDTVSSVEGLLQTIKVPSKLATTNTARIRSNRLKKLSGYGEVKETMQIMKASVSEACDSNVISGKKNKRPKQQTSSSKIINPSVESVPAIRRSQRSLTRMSFKKVTPIGLKKVKCGTKRIKVLKKEVVKKEILKKVIAKEVEAMEGDGNRNVFENSNLNKLINSPLLPPGLLKAPTPTSIRVVTLTPEVMRKLKETVLKNSSSTTPNHIRLVVPSEIISKIQNTAAKNQNSETPKVSMTTTTAPNMLAKIAGSPADTASTSNLGSGSPIMEIIRYNLEDVKRDQLRRKEERAKNAEKGKIYLKMLEKFDEKERKKQVKFCEKKLSRFINKHRQSHLDEMKERLLNVRNLSPENGVLLLKDVIGLGCPECKQVIGSTLCSLGFGNEKELFGSDKALQGFIALSTSKIKKKGKIPLNSSQVGDQKKKPVGRPRVMTKAQSSPMKLATVPPKKESSPVKLAKVSPEKESSPMKLAEVSPEKESSPRKLTQILPQKDTCLEKTSYSNNIECSPNKEHLSHLNSGVKSYQAPKQKPLLIKTDLTKTKRRGNIGKKAKDISPVIGDPFTDTSIITEEKFVLKCAWCQNPNCDGLHPENFLV